MNIRRTVFWSTFLAVSTFTVLTLPHLRRPTAERAGWKGILESSRDCGVNQQCQLVVEGFDPDSKRRVAGTAAVIAVTGHGLLVDLEGKRCWLDEDATRRASAHTVLPGNCTLHVGQSTAMRQLRPQVEGRSLAYVVRRLWLTVVAGPDPSTYSSAYDWDVNDVRLDGRLTPTSTPRVRDIKPESGIYWNGRELVFDHAKMRDVLEFRGEVWIQRADLTATLPRIAPDPGLTPAFFEENWD